MYCAWLCIHFAKSKSIKVSIVQGKEVSTVWQAQWELGTCQGEGGGSAGEESRLREGEYVQNVSVHICNYQKIQLNV